MPPNMQEALPNVTANIIFIIVFVKRLCFLREPNIRSSWLPFTGRSLQSPMAEPGCKTKETNVWKKKKKQMSGTSLAVQWLILYTSTAEGAGSIPGPGTKIPHASWCGQLFKDKNKQMS